MKTTAAAKTKAVQAVQTEITKKRKAGLSYDSPELRSLMAQMDKLTGFTG